VPNLSQNHAVQRTAALIHYPSSVDDAPVTAVARFFELVMLTAATIAGVAFVLHVVARLGAPELTISPNAPPPLTELPVRIAFGAASSAAFALACYAERRAAAATAVGGTAGVTGFLIAQAWVPAPSSPRSPPQCRSGWSAG
jgi:hypothetical protein